MKNLVVDIGNSKIKLAAFEGTALIQEITCGGLEALFPAVQNIPFDEVIVSSVKWGLEEIKSYFPYPFIYLSDKTPLPIKNLYASPQSLGVDRIAAVVGALGLVGNGPLLAIDLGTCITYDFLNGKKEYLGGAISPGIKMRFEAMHKFTARLPLTGWAGESVELVGNNTHSSLQSGVYYGVKHEIEGVIADYKRQYNELKVFICGGDANFFESLTKDHIFVIPNLILHGLNRILTYNVNKK